MAVSSIKNVEEGALISFRSKRATDTVTWKGTLESVGTYRSIKDRMNPSSYNEGVRQVDPSVPSDVTLLTYFLITVDNDATTPTMQVFADEWIVPGSLYVISPGSQVTVVVDDPKQDPTAIVSLLASAGYSSKIVS